MSEAQVTIRELKMNGVTAIRIAACLKKHEPEIWEVLREELKQSMREVEVTHSTEQSTADPYYTDPATWPEWANWRAVGEDGCVYFSSILMEANTLYGSWSTSIYAASKMVPRAVTHNPNWRNSLRSREEVSRGK